MRCKRIEVTSGYVEGLGAEVRSGGYTDALLRYYSVASRKRFAAFLSTPDDL